MAIDQFINLISALILLFAAVVLGAIAGLIVYMIYKGRAPESIASFVFETSADGKGGKPSVSRLQMLIWNFIVAFAFLFVVGRDGSIMNGIEALLQPSVLTLLGISNATYLLGKVTKQASAKPEIENSQAASGQKKQK
jgi:hypothetical protein